MPRPRRRRRVGFQPDVTYFKPAGVRMIELEETVLTVDEFESIRLKDLEGLEQEECAKKMNISQPTFHRMVTSARKKIADFLVKGKAIKIKGGNFKIVQPRMKGGRGFKGGFARGPGGECLCSNCGHREPHEVGIPCYAKKCPKCGSLMTRA